MVFYFVYFVVNKIQLKYQEPHLLLNPDPFDHIDSIAPFCLNDLCTLQEDKMCSFFCQTASLDWMLYLILTQEIENHRVLLD